MLSNVSKYLIETTSSYFNILHLHSYDVINQKSKNKIV